MYFKTASSVLINVLELDFVSIKNILGLNNCFWFVYISVNISVRNRVKITQMTECLLTTYYKYKWGYMVWQTFEIIRTQTYN